MQAVQVEAGRMRRRALNERAEQQGTPPPPSADTDLQASTVGHSEASPTNNHWADILDDPDAASGPNPPG